MKRLKQGGETIVEVLIVVMVLGSALTSAFVVTRKATSSDQTAQERTEASEYAQGQIERLRLYLSSASATPLPATFCFNDDASSALSSASDVSPGCLSTAGNGRYRSFFQSPTVGVYLETTRWDNTENSQSNVTLYYKPGN